MVDVEPYGFTVSFEHALAAMLCCRPHLYSQLGPHVEYNALTSPAAQTLVKAVKEMANECSGRGPDSFIAVVQHLRRWHNEGRVTQEQIDVAVDAMCDAEDDGLPSDVFMLAEVLPVLRRRAQGEAIREAIDAHGKRNDLQKIADKLQRAGRLGESSADSPGVLLSSASFSAIAALKKLVRLELGVPEIDTVLEGGLWRKGLGTVIADTGGGKSMMLSHYGSHATETGHFVGYATLELPEAIVLARMKANILNIPVNSIMAGSEEAVRKMEEIEASLGKCVVKSFTPRATTVADIIRWVEMLEQEHGRAMDLLVVDYADKLTAGKDVSSYAAGEAIYEDLRVFGYDNDKWIWTASQSKGRDSKKKKLDTTDVADSVHKVRSADMVVTITVKDDGEQLLFYVGKNRLGRAHMSVGPMPHEFEYGRVAPVLSGIGAEEFDDAW